MPLLDAARGYAVLRGYLESTATEWDTVYFLRQVCLGREINDDQRAELAREHLLNQDGSVEATLQSLVLSAVRGEGRVLHLESPYVDHEDRLLAELIVARDELPKALRDEVEANDPGAAIKEAIDGTPVPPGLRQNFEDKLKEILRREKTTDAGPSPDDPPAAPPR